MWMVPSHLNMSKILQQLVGGIEKPLIAPNTANQPEYVAAQN